DSRLERAVHIGRGQWWSLTVSIAPVLAGSSIRSLRPLSQVRPIRELVQDIGDIHNPKSPRLLGEPTQQVRMPLPVDHEHPVGRPPSHLHQVAEYPQIPGVPVPYPVGAGLQLTISHGGDIEVNPVGCR